MIVTSASSLLLARGPQRSLSSASRDGFERGNRDGERGFSPFTEYESHTRPCAKVSRSFV